MEERKERIKGLIDLMGQMDDAGKDMAKVAATCIEIGVEIGMAKEKKRQKEEEKEVG